MRVQQKLRFLWKSHRLALLAFVTVAALTGYFGIRSAAEMMYWSNPDHRDQPLAAWMTPRYVAQSYDLPPDVIGPALMGNPDDPPPRKSIGRIAAENGMTVADLQSRVKAAADQWRTEQSQ